MRNSEGRFCHKSQVSHPVTAVTSVTFGDGCAFWLYRSAFWLPSATTIKPTNTTYTSVACRW